MAYVLLLLALTCAVRSQECTTDDCESDQYHTVRIPTLSSIWSSISDAAESVADRASKVASGAADGSAPILSNALDTAAWFVDTAVDDFGRLMHTPPAEWGAHLRGTLITEWALLTGDDRLAQSVHEGTRGGEATVFARVVVLAETHESEKTDLGKHGHLQKMVGILASGAAPSPTGNRDEYQRTGLLYLDYIRKLRGSSSLRALLEELKLVIDESDTDLLLQDTLPSRRLLAPIINSPRYDAGLGGYPSDKSDHPKYRLSKAVLEKWEDELA